MNIISRNHCNINCTLNCITLAYIWLGLLHGWCGCGSNHSHSLVFAMDETHLEIARAGNSVCLVPKDISFSFLFVLHSLKVSSPRLMRSPSNTLLNSPRPHTTMFVLFKLMPCLYVDVCAFLLVPEDFEWSEFADYWCLFLVDCRLSTPT